jgi:pyridoxine 5-phosphate synthase
VRLNHEALTDAIRRLQDGGLVVSLFVDPDTDQIKAAAKCGADYVELHTGSYADATDWQTEQGELRKLEDAVRLARKLELGVNAGHGLNYLNIKKLASTGGIEEFNIGHSIISRAVLVGMDRAVRDMVDLVKYA